MVRHIGAPGIAQGDGSCLLFGTNQLIKGVTAELGYPGGAGMP
jgi:hypothetical protein